MRGVDARDGSLFSSVDLEARVPPTHPRRVIRRLADAVLAAMSAAVRCRLPESYVPRGSSRTTRAACGQLHRHHAPPYRHQARTQFAAMSLLLAGAPARKCPWRGQAKFMTQEN